MDFKIDGLDQLQKKLEILAKAATPREMARRMSATRCPIHGGSPVNVRVVGDEVTAEFCCERARDVATRAATDGITSQLG